MSLVEQMHAAHKQDQPVISVDDRLVSYLRQEITSLREEVRRQAGIIADQEVYIEKLAGVAADTTPKLDEVFNCCCKFYGVSPNDMRSPTKALGLPYRRQIFYFLAREYGHSLHQIGRHIHKDHSSVLYGSAKIRGLVGTDEQLSGEIEALRLKIAARTFERRRVLDELMERAS
jgi:chromosomal replication initiation ATPase DnaA